MCAYAVSADVIRLIVANCTRMLSMTPDELTMVRNLLASDEDFRQFPYTDTTGNLTIGFGRNLNSVGISRPEAQELLTNDINYFAAAIADSHSFFDGLCPARKLVVIDICFNVGLNGFSKFVLLLAALGEGNYEQAAIEILQSKAAAQLPKRYQRLAQMMRTGELNNV